MEKKKKLSKETEELLKIVWDSSRLTIKALKKFEKASRLITLRNILFDILVRAGINYYEAMGICEDIKLQVVEEIKGKKKISSPNHLSKENPFTG